MKAHILLCTVENTFHTVGVGIIHWTNARWKHLVSMLSSGD